jgi:hypothetical protein
MHVCQVRYDRRGNNPWTCAFLNNRKAQPATLASTTQVHSHGMQLRPALLDALLGLVVRYNVSCDGCSTADTSLQIRLEGRCVRWVVRPNHRYDSTLHALSASRAAGIAAQLSNQHALQAPVSAQQQHTLQNPWTSLRRSSLLCEGSSPACTRATRISSLQRQAAGHQQ